MLNRATVPLGFRAPTLTTSIVVRMRPGTCVGWWRRCRPRRTGRPRWPPGPQRTDQRGVRLLVVRFLVVVPERHGHGVDPARLATEVLDRASAAGALTIVDSSGTKPSASITLTIKMFGVGAGLPDDAGDEGAVAREVVEQALEGSCEHVPVSLRLVADRATAGSSRRVDVHPVAEPGVATEPGVEDDNDGRSVTQLSGERGPDPAIGDGRPAAEPGNGVLQSATPPPAVMVPPTVMVPPASWCRLRSSSRRRSWSGPRMSADMRWSRPTAIGLIRRGWPRSLPGGAPALSIGAARLSGPGTTDRVTASPRCCVACQPGCPPDVPSIGGHRRRWWLSSAGRRRG